MKTDTSQALCIALTSFLFLASVVSITEGKCAGRWAIHACWGGNGKRSGPTMDDASSPNLLRQLLLRNSPSYAFPSLVEESSVDAPVDPEDLGSSYNSDLSDYPVLPLRSADRLTALLRMLKTLQKENEELP